MLTSSSSSDPCCSVPLDSSYTILVFSPRTPTVTRAGRRRKGQEGSSIAHCGHRMNTGKNLDCGEFDKFSYAPVRNSRPPGHPPRAGGRRYDHRLPGHIAFRCQTVGDTSVSHPRPQPPERLTQAAALTVSHPSGRKSPT